MSSTAIATLVKMVETLPENTQELIVEHLREYIATLQDEIQWDMTFENTSSQLIAAARQAKQDIAAGHATIMDHSQL